MNVILATAICKPTMIFAPYFSFSNKCSGVNNISASIGIIAGCIARLPRQSPRSIQIKLRCIPHPGQSICSKARDGQVSICCCKKLIRLTATKIALFAHTRRFTPVSLFSPIQ